MTMTDEPIRSSSAPEGWQPPTTHEKPAYQPKDKDTNDWQPPNITHNTYVDPRNPVIDASGGGGDVSPSQLAKMAGVKPQMIYNYIAGGMIEAFLNAQGKKRITREEAERWLNKYLTNKEERNKQRKDQLRRELNGEA